MSPCNVGQIVLYQQIMYNNMCFVCVHGTRNTLRLRMNAAHAHFSVKQFIQGTTGVTAISFQKQLIRLFSGAIPESASTRHLASSNICTPGCHTRRTPLATSQPRTVSKLILLLQSSRLQSVSSPSNRGSSATSDAATDVASANTAKQPVVSSNSICLASVLFILSSFCRPSFLHFLFSLSSCRLLCPRLCLHTLTMGQARNSLTQGATPMRSPNSHAH